MTNNIPVEHDLIKPWPLMHSKTLWTKAFTKYINVKVRQQQCGGGGVILKIMHYNIVLLPKTVTNSVT